MCSLLRPWQATQTGNVGSEAANPVVSSRIGGRASSGGALAPEPPRATRREPEPDKLLRIFPSKLMDIFIQIDLEIHFLKSGHAPVP